MMPASTNGGGQCAIPGPLDFCKTPTPGGPVPMPYPNFGMANQASGGTCSSKVKICGKKTIVKGTEIPMSTGDEGGVAGGGVVSSRFKGPVKYKKGSGKVKAEGKPICHLSSMTGHNGNNANMPAGVQVAPSQTKVTVSP
jgi:hypothetical protein